MTEPLKQSEIDDLLANAGNSPPQIMKRLVGGKCPHCGAGYGFGPQNNNTCDHLLCTDYHDEGPFPYMEVPNSPETLSLLDIPVPDAVAREFLGQEEIRAKISTLSKEESGGEHHVHWTYHLTEDPPAMVDRLFEFVLNNYFEADIGELPYHSSRTGKSGDIQLITVHTDELKRMKADLNHWLMFTGPFPHGRPRFLLMENASNYAFGDWCMPGEVDVKTDDDGYPRSIVLAMLKEPLDAPLKLTMLKILPNITIQ